MNTEEANATEIDRFSRQTRSIQQLENALTALLNNVEAFGFENISIEDPMADGVPLARKALGRFEYTQAEPLDPRRGEEPICDSD